MTRGILKLGCLAVAAACAVVALPWSGAANAASCAADLVTEAGTCAIPVAGRPLTSAQKALLANKIASHDQNLVAIQSASAAGGQVTPNTLPGGGGGGAPSPRDFAISRAKTMTIFKEGQGNGKKSYTCGPAASRNVLFAMYNHDYGEATIAGWEGTTTAGTARANVASALNAHFSSVWVTSRPGSRDDYLAYVASDTQQGQGVIANIDTEELSFFNNKALDHFDYVYGYDNTAATRYLYIGEEWDPVYTYGSSSYGNPFGRHKEVLSNAYSAVDKTSIHGIVW